MKKSLNIYLIFVIFLMSVGVNSVFASKDPSGSITSVKSSREHPSVFINNEKLDIYANVTTLGTTLVPMRPIFEAYGMTVEWDNTTKTVTATEGDDKIQLTNNSYEAYVNGSKVALTQAPSLEPDSNIFFVNLRFISEAIGAKVTWSKTANGASIYINFTE
ncbi:copper amine oxidase N-terminal domain-containing protein [Paenibacillus borealis]|uniref:copper amine oxidase N-terminal domain-containing protein n=1 Tax=Paenibacillus borealis TaxID=160799 RepID=UPI0006940A7F|nr:copper amine oxidase N-terminal domain-containing protein [Paenibacillus borealis]